MPDATTNSAAAISVTAMARRVGLSRARFYDLVSEGFFAAPVSLLRNRRPVYLASMVERNLFAKETGVGINGVVRVFNESVEASSANDTPSTSTGTRTRRPRATRNASRSTVSQRSSRPSESDELVQRLVSAQRQLGLNDANAERVSAALAEVCPNGTSGVDEGDLIRGVYRRLRASTNA